MSQPPKWPPACADGPGLVGGGFLPGPASLSLPRCLEERPAQAGSGSETGKSRQLRDEAACRRQTHTRQLKTEQHLLPVRCPGPGSFLAPCPVPNAVHLPSCPQSPEAGLQKCGLGFPTVDRVLPSVNPTRQDLEGKKGRLLNALRSKPFTVAADFFSS